MTGKPTTEIPRPSPAEPATLTDVARRAGVSTATVSRSLNAPAMVAEATRQRVQAVVAELGYTPNFGARSLAARRTDTFGAVIPTMENSIFARGLQAFQEELGRSGITLLVASSSYRPDLEEEQIRALVARGADALLLIGHHRDPGIYRFLEGRGVPAAVAWAHDDSAPVPSVGFDNLSAMKALVARVVSYGHADIGMISAEREFNDRARDRVTGTREAMREAGLNPDRLALVETTYAVESGRAAFRELMHRSPRPTAVVCGNDVLAVGAIQMAQDMGLDVPGDVSITGFDDIEIATVVRPALTTVHVPHRRMGRDAARLLAQMVEDRALRRSERLDAEIRERATLGPHSGA